MGGTRPGLHGTENRPCFEGTTRFVFWATAAILITSASLGSVAGVAVVPADAAPLTAYHATASVAVADAATARSPDPFIGPRPVLAPVPIDRVPAMRGIPLLSQFSLLKRGELRELIGGHPQLIDETLAVPAAAADISGWWALTSPQARSDLRGVVPELVGNLEGVPYGVRDVANRSYLRDAIASITEQLADGVGRARTADLKTRLHMLEQIEEAIASRPGEARRYLVSIDSTGEGRAVISSGDLATADYVSLLVPGMFYGVDARIVPWTDCAADLATEQRDWLDRLGRTAERVAVVSWIGYHTPTLANVASMENARQGQKALTASLLGLAAARADRMPFVSVLAHSYGSTAALLSLSEDDVGVDALAMVGSPGGPARSVRELNVPEGRVWVGAAPWDPIPDSGVFGNQPMSEEFGARVMGVDGGRDPITSAWLAGTVSHNDYFAEGNETMRNFALIGIGAPQFVLTESGSMAAAAPREAD